MTGNNGLRKGEARESYPMIIMGGGALAGHPQRRLQPNNRGSLLNISSERTAHSVRFLAIRGVVSCGPPLTAGVRLQTKSQAKTTPYI
jgi:hypothetical protein